MDSLEARQEEDKDYEDQGTPKKVKSQNVKIIKQNTICIVSKCWQQLLVYDFH